MDVRKLLLNLRARLGYLLFAVFYAAIPFHARADNIPTDAEIKTILQDFIDRDHWGVGMVVGIVDEHGTRIISYGKLDNGDSPAVNGDTLFEIGSITKTFIALVTQDMVDRGEMKWNDPVEKCLPASVKVPDWKGRKITLLDLATHTSGLPRDIDEWTVPGLYKALSHAQLQSEPGTKPVYSNFGFSLLAHVLELKTGTNFEALVQQRICRPLGMNSTYILPTPELRPRWTKSHAEENRTTWDMDSFYAGVSAGALRSSANDMLKYLAAEIGLTNSSLTPLMQKTHTIHFPHVFGEADLALPWWIYHWDGSEIISHGGTTGGQKAYIGFDKKLRRGVVVLANRKDLFDQAVPSLGAFLLHPPANNHIPVKVSPEILDSYTGLYESGALPNMVLTIRHEREGLRIQLVDAVGFQWFAQLPTEFFPEWGGGDMKFTRGLMGGVTVSFFSDGKILSHFEKISSHVPHSLFEPMLQPLAANEIIPNGKSDLQGAWVGRLRPWYWPFVSRRGEVKIAERPTGTFGELTVPKEGVDKLPVAVIYNPPEVELVAKSGAGIFKGKINPAHTRITGHFIQGNRSVGGVLWRVDAQPKKQTSAAKN